MSTHQYPLTLPHNEAMDIDDFMITNSNRDAMAWVNRWPDWPARCFIIYGPSGSGKSHLLNVWLTKSRGRLLDLNELAKNDAAILLSGNKYMALDNAEKIRGNVIQEEALFHLYNLAHESKGYMLLTAWAAPAQWNIQLPDLRSRLLSVPAVPLAPPDDELLTALLIKQFRDRQIDIGTDVISYLLPRMTRTPAFIRALVTSLDHASLAEGHRITVTMARRLLVELPKDERFLIS
jgi:DnaA regulatory inactivator Hda